MIHFKEDDIGELSTEVVGGLEKVRLMGALAHQLAVVHEQAGEIESTLRRIPSSERYWGPPDGHLFILSSWDGLDIAGYHSKTDCYDDSGWETTRQVDTYDRRAHARRAFIARGVELDRERQFAVGWDGKQRCLLSGKNSVEISVVPKNEAPRLAINPIKRSKVPA